jgi:uncharacterized repeat protein (TIGR01451 family)
MTYAFSSISGYPSIRYPALALGLLASGWAVPALAAGVPAGSLIQNTATATFSQGAASETVSSNTVTIQVDELLDVAVASLDGGNVVLTSSGAVLRYQVQNTGNGPEAFVLQIDPAVAGDDFDPVVSQIAWDSNGNGIYDAGVDAILANGTAAPVLAPDAIGQAFVVTSWSSPPADGSRADVRLTALAVTGTGAPGTVFAGQGQGGGDAVVGAQMAQGDALGSLITHSATVSLTKSAVIADPFGGTEAVPGALVTYTLVATVAGSGSVNGLVVSDPIPAGTTYRANSLRLDAASLTDAPADDAGSASASGIAVDLGTVAGGASHSVTFTVALD